MTKQPNRQSAFTLLEILLVLALILLLTSILFRSLPTNHYSEKVFHKELLSFIQSAQSTAISQKSKTSIHSDQLSITYHYQNPHTLKSTKRYLSIPPEVHLAEPINVMFSENGTPSHPAIISLSHDTQLVIPYSGQAFLNP